MIIGLDRAVRERSCVHRPRLPAGIDAASDVNDGRRWARCDRVKYVEAAKRKADKQLRKADDDLERLHRARKAEKRLRYAAEFAEPADSRMKRIARDAKDMQTLLGEHQDAVVAANFPPPSVLHPTERMATAASPTAFWWPMS